jgi:hypothetical protein
LIVRLILRVGLRRLVRARGENDAHRDGVEPTPTLMRAVARALRLGGEWRPWSFGPALKLQYSQLCTATCYYILMSSVSETWQTDCSYITCALWPYERRKVQYDPQHSHFPDASTRTHANKSAPMVRADLCAHRFSRGRVVFTRVRADILLPQSPRRLTTRHRPPPTNPRNATRASRSATARNPPSPRTRRRRWTAG